MSVSESQQSCFPSRSRYFCVTPEPVIFRPSLGGSRLALCCKAMPHPLFPVDLFISKKFYCIFCSSVLSMPYNSCGHQKPSHDVGPRNPIQVVRPSCNHLFLLGHLWSKRLLCLSYFLVLQIHWVPKGKIGNLLSWQPIRKHLSSQDPFS